MEIEKETVEAVKEVAKLGTKALDAAQQFGGYVSRMIGTVLEDAVGITIGDPLRQARIKRVLGYESEVAEILKKRKVDQIQAVSPNLTIQLIQAAQDETRDELRRMWAGLIASAMDPARAGAVRQNIIETVKTFDPLDAVILREAFLLPDSNSAKVASVLPEKLKISPDEFEVSVQNLKRLGCIDTLGMVKIGFINISEQIIFKHLGREILRACSD